VSQPIVSEHQQLADKIDRVEGRLMARIDDLQSGLDTLIANVADYTADVTATLAEVKGQLSAALSKQSADAAELQYQVPMKLRPDQAASPCTRPSARPSAWAAATARRCSAWCWCSRRS
jgi:ABC-type transporter Mla subunit MlaD